MATGSPVLFADFSGGLNLEAGPYLVQDNECQAARNVTASRQGALVKRNGFTDFADLTDDNDAGTAIIDDIHTLFPVSLAAGNSFVAVGKTTGAATDSIVKITTAGVTSSLKAALTQGERWSFVQGPVALNGASADQGPIYGMNGTDTPQQWDGSAGSTTAWTANTGTVPTGTTELHYHLDKLWASGDPANPGRIWSTGVDTTTNLPDPCNWDTDYIDDVDPADGQNITALGSVGPYLLVFKNRKTYVLSDPVGRSYRQLSDSAGCSAPRSVVQTTQGTMFFSEDLGVCMTDGTQIQVVSDKILPLLRTSANTYPAQLKEAAGVFHNDSYYLSIPSTSVSNDITLEYQLSTGAWWIHSCASNDWAILDPQGTPRLYSADPTVDKVSQAFVPDTYTDGTVAFESYWEGPFWVWGQPHLNKRLSQFRVDGRGLWRLQAATSFVGSEPEYDTLDFVEWEVPIDSSASDTYAGSGNWEGTGTFAPQLGVTQRRYYTPIQGWGRAWSLRVDDSNANVIEIYSIGAFTRPRAD